ncbi:MAG: replication-associated recombination protein A [Acutalibacteraceae bacterium]|nr:replication-associated recombination protein A [Acutalibacteraceae bacterium]
MLAPLADRMRPKKIEDMVGQQHLIGKNKMLYNIIKSGKIPNMIFYGPSGVGKTTLASIIADGANMQLRKLNGTNCSTADIKQIVEETKTLAGIDGILLYLDEIQYLNKKQQQSLLQYIENGAITLIASTTENPYFYVYSAILSRSTVFEFKPVEACDTVPVINRSFDKMREEIGEIKVDEDAVKTISSRCGGDVRKAINAVELCVLSAPETNGKRIVTKQLAEELTQRSGMRYDRDGDEHYDIISAYQKSMRGSDPDAALHYLARLLQAGDLASACRRLMVCANEDVGLAYPQIIPIVKAAVDTAQALGLPEARIPLANAVVLVAISPKSNSAYNAINSAYEDVSTGNTGPIPRQLQNKHFDSAEVENKGQFYKYPHDFKNHYVAQQYLPDKIKNRKYYIYGNNKNEQSFKKYWDSIK